jgi:hypothetical protein
MPPYVQTTRPFEQAMPENTSPKKQESAQFRQIQVLICSKKSPKYGKKRVVSVVIV